MTGGAVDLRAPATLLAAWEAAAAAPGHHRGPALLAALGVTPAADALDLPLDRLGGALARQHTDAFGRCVAGVLTCPTCASTLDLDVDLAQLFPREPPDPTGTGRLVMRTPSSRDLIAADRAADPAAEIVRRCVRGPGDVAGLDAADRAVLDEELAERVGPGLPTLQTTCPDCGSVVTALVDPAVLLWASIEAHAAALLQDVADLAAAFGWRESDILALPARRRAAYLELARR